MQKGRRILIVIGVALGGALGALAANGKSTAWLSADQSRSPGQEATPDNRATVLPRPAQPFGGIIGRTAKVSVKDFPKEVQAPKGAPNVLLIMTDDVGFGASSTFGGPIPTPNFDRLAKVGLRYNQFHTTALCSPSRAALISGRNHHACATGGIMEIGTGFPGYNTLMPKSCGTVAEILKQNGYNTSWFGKNHNVPDWHSTQAGPFDLWPTGLGFEHFYGFIGGDTNEWAPALYDGVKPVEKPHGDKDYHFDKDMADRAINWMRLQNALAPDKPFFLYYVPGSAHAPHHAPKDWIAKFKGKFDHGWDEQRRITMENQKALGVVPAGTKLTPRSPGIPAWDDLNADQKKLYARMMEVYAAALAHCDYHIGRLLDAVEETGEMDNTLVIYIMGDNGASAEGSAQGLLNEMAFFNALPEDPAVLLKRMDELGGPTTYNHYPIGWAHAMDTPFQWTKQIASHFGGTRNGMVMRWPKRIPGRGELRTQFHHITDIAPTILEAAGVGAPTELNGVPQKPIEGVSMAYTWDDAKALSRRKTQYFEMFANRALYHDGWVACTTPLTPPWQSLPNPGGPDAFQWELYNIAEDFSQADNVALKHPEKLRELQDLFWVEAAKNTVLPLDDSRIERLDVANRPSLTRGRNRFDYYSGMTRISEGGSPDLKNRSYQITAEVEIPEKGAEGVLATQGGRFSGWGLLVRDTTPVFHYNLADVERFTIAAKDKLTSGKHTVQFQFTYDGGKPGSGGKGVLLVDGNQVAEGRIGRTLGYRVSLDETLDVGEDSGTAVDPAYEEKMPFQFTGKLGKVTIELK